MAAAAVLWLVFAPAWARAQSLMEHYQGAYRNDPAVRAAQHTVQAAQARLDQATGAFGPNVTLVVSLGRTHSSTDAQRMPGAPMTNTDRHAGNEGLELTLRQPLYQRSLIVTKQQAENALETAHIALRAAEQDLRFRVAEAYMNVLDAQDLLTYQHLQKQAVLAQLQRAKMNFEVGSATITDSREAQAHYDAIAAQELAARNDWAIKRLTLAQLSNQAEANPWPLTLPLRLHELQAMMLPEETRKEAWLDAALQNNAAVQKALRDVQAARLLVVKAQSGHWPTLDFVARSSQTRSSESALAGALNSRANTHSANLLLTLPLFAGFTTAAAVAEAAALQSKAEADLEAAKRTVKHHLESSWLGLQSARSQVQANETAVLSSQSALEANRLGYLVGMRVSGDVLSSESQLAQAQSDLSKARYGAILQHLRLLQYSGALEDSHLEKVSQQFAMPALAQGSSEPAASPATRIKSNVEGAGTGTAHAHNSRHRSPAAAAGRRHSSSRRKPGPLLARPILPIPLSGFSR